MDDARFNAMLLEIGKTVYASVSQVTSRECVAHHSILGVTDEVMSGLDEVQVVVMNELVYKLFNNMMKDHGDFEKL